jgi:hypothetical protein
MAKHECNDTVLNAIQADRRGFVKRIVAGTAFAAPVLATFAIDALTARSAHAEGANYFPTPTPEPSALLLMGTAAVGLGAAAYRRSKGEKSEPKSE